MEFNFQRQLFIKNLFLPEEIINAFDWVEFENIEIFKRCVKDDLYNIKEGSMCHIHIDTHEDFMFLNYLSKAKPNFFSRMGVYLHFRDNDLLKECIGNKINESFHFHAVVYKPLQLGELWGINREWVSKNMVVLRWDIKESTLEADICNLIKNYNLNNIRFFWLNIDYTSFINLSLKELDRIEFFFYNLRIWMSENVDKSIKLTILSSEKFIKRIFVAENRVLYLDSTKDPIWNFPLGVYLDDDGNSINSRLLNKLHTYLDLTSFAIYREGNIHNYMLVSPLQSLQMGYYINEIPLIMTLIQRWLYG